MLRGLYACAGGERNKFGGEWVGGGMVMNRKVREMRAAYSLQAWWAQGLRMMAEGLRWKDGSEVEERPQGYEAP
jgi:hypothetical protein